MYRQIIFWHRLAEVRVGLQDYIQYVICSGIFFPPDLKTRFDDIVTAMIQAINEKAYGHEGKDIEREQESWRKVSEKIGPMIQDLNNQLHLRLRSHGMQR